MASDIEAIEEAAERNLNPQLPKWPLMRHYSVFEAAVAEAVEEAEEAWETYDLRMKTHWIESVASL